MLILNSAGGTCPNGSDTMQINVNNTPVLALSPLGFAYNICPSDSLDLSSLNIVDNNNAGGTYS